MGGFHQAESSPTNVIPTKLPSFIYWFTSFLQSCSGLKLWSIWLRLLKCFLWNPQSTYELIALSPTVTNAHCISQRSSVVLNGCLSGPPSSNRQLQVQKTKPHCIFFMVIIVWNACVWMCLKIFHSLHKLKISIQQWQSIKVPGSGNFPKICTKENLFHHVWIRCWVLQTCRKNITGQERFCRLQSEQF